MSQPYQFQPQHSGLTRLSVNEVAAQRAALGALGISDMQAAISDIKDVTFGSKTERPVATYIYVDSVGGSDANAGTESLPKKTLGAITFQNGLVVRLKRGSTFRETIDQTVCTSITVEAYGPETDAQPIVRCDNVVNTTWTKTAGRTNIYETTVTHNLVAGFATYHRVWENDVRLLRAASLTALDSASGSFYAASPTGATQTIYVNVGSNPASNGKVYEYAARPFGVNLGEYGTIRHITGMRNGGKDGAIRVQGRDGLIEYCDALDGKTHNLFIASGIVRNSRAIDCELETNPGSATLFVAYQNDPSGQLAIFENCVADALTYNDGTNGFYAHGSTLGWDKVIFKNCRASNCGLGISASATTLSIVGCLFNDNKTAVSGEATNLYLLRSIVDNRAGSNLVLSGVGSLAPNQTIVGNQFHFKAANNSTLRFVENNKTLIIKNNTFHCIGTGTNYGIEILGTGCKATIENNVFIHPWIFGITIDHTLTAGSSIDYNAYYDVNRNSYNGTVGFTPSFTPWKTALAAFGGEAHSIFTPAGVPPYTNLPVFGDFFAFSDDSIHANGIKGAGHETAYIETIEAVALEIKLLNYIERFSIQDQQGVNTFNVFYDPPSYSVFEFVSQGLLSGPFEPLTLRANAEEGFLLSQYGNRIQITQGGLILDGQVGFANPAGFAMFDAANGEDGTLQFADALLLVSSNTLGLKTVAWVEDTTPRAVGVDNRIVRFDQASGDIQSSGIILTDTNGLTQVSLIDSNGYGVGNLTLNGSGGKIQFQTGGFDRWQIGPGNDFYPTNNNAYNVGTSGLRVVTYFGYNLDLTNTVTAKGTGTHTFGTTNTVTMTAGKLVTSDSIKVGIRTIATLPLASTCNGEVYEISDSPIFGNRFVKSDGSVWFYEGTAYQVGTSPSSGGAWGSITGTLSSQTDLQTALNLKADSLGINRHPGFISGNWYHFIEDTFVATGTALATNSIRLYPFILRESVTVNSLGCRITTASAGGNIQLALYGHNASTGRPTGNALCNSSSISTTTATAVNSVNAGGNTTLSPGTYWMATNSDNAVVVCNVGSNVAGTRMGYITGSPTQTNIASAASSIGFSVSVAQTFGTWPDLTSATFVESVSGAAVNAAPLLHFKQA